MARWALARTPVSVTADWCAPSMELVRRRAPAEDGAELLGPSRCARACSNACSSWRARPRRPATPGGWDAVVLTGPIRPRPFWEATTTAPWRARSRRWPGCRGRRWWWPSSSTPTPTGTALRRADKEASGLGDGGPRGRPWTVPYWFVDGGFAPCSCCWARPTPASAPASSATSGERTTCGAPSAFPTGRRYVGAVAHGEPRRGATLRRPLWPGKGAPWTRRPPRSVVRCWVPPPPVPTVPS